MKSGPCDSKRLPELLLVLFVFSGCGGSDVLREEDPVAYWERELRRRFPGSGGQVTFGGLDQKDASTLIIACATICDR